jgi:hypothetical protein
MISTILATIVGLLGSIVPDVFKQFQDRRDKAHELALAQLQVEQQKQGHVQRLEEINTQADVAEMMSLADRLPKRSGVRWIDGMNGMVRPVVAFWFMALYTFSKVGLFVSMIQSDPALPWLMKDWTQAAVLLWGAEDQAIFAAIISFYFGSRAMQRTREGKLNG